MKRFFIVLGMLALMLSLSLVNVSAKEVTIQFWHAMGGHNMEVVNSLVDQFNKTHPGIKVEAQMAGTYDDVLSKTQAAVRTKTAPHVIQIFEIGTRVMIDSGIIIPVEDLGKKVARDRSFNWNKWIKPVANYYRMDGKLNSMPFNSSTPLLYYNKTFFKQAGLDPNQPPQTFEDLKKYAEKLTVRDAQGAVTRYGMTLAIYGWFAEQMSYNQDALYVNNNNGRTGRPTKALFNGPALVRFLDLWKAMVDQGTMLNAGAGTAPAQQAFLSGRAAMMFESTAQVNNFENGLKKIGSELGTAYLPLPKGVKRGGVCIGGASLWVTKDHPEEELKATWEFLKWLTLTEQQVYWFENTGYFPTTLSAVEAAKKTRFFTEHPNYATAFQQLLIAKNDYATQGAVMGSFAAVRKTVEDAVEEVLSGKKTTKKALDDAAAKVDKMLAEYNSLYQ
ncbi:carbohydrate ABC transporter substrate-binding protein (CUT1 family) [Hydrogenispora ethanolica]|uniref:Carbohydrate ABC transporter substrate-binding protein (CUT1 family) n=1 Tax=Hydrogenispora ethanolica TaxID=1082276 RepID=A0A4V2QFF6_HYDET|nr:ABC transporter substrate-binding protein [Hydrogenispora ethanolica]TCL71667.1 carbohydrate ABC transporter substrate-binding protein (CUT1 family) [Hydrogenispora ethanolica]